VRSVRAMFLPDWERDVSDWGSSDNISQDSSFTQFQSFPIIEPIRNLQQEIACLKTIRQTT
jgi:hypothetical protein